MEEGPDQVGPCSNPTAILCQSDTSEVKIIIIMKWFFNRYIGPKSEINNCKLRYPKWPDNKVNEVGRAVRNEDPVLPCILISQRTLHSGFF